MPFKAARFNFTLAEDLKEAASDERVKSELGTKISRERIGHEVGYLDAYTTYSYLLFALFFAALLYNLAVSHS